MAIGKGHVFVRKWALIWCDTQQEWQQYGQHCRQTGAENWCRNGGKLWQSTALPPPPFILGLAITLAPIAPLNLYCTLTCTVVRVDLPIMLASTLPHAEEPGGAIAPQGFVSVFLTTAAAEGKTLHVYYLTRPSPCVLVLLSCSFPCADCNCHGRCNKYGGIWERTIVCSHVHGRSQLVNVKTVPWCCKWLLLAPVVIRI